MRLVNESVKQTGEFQSVVFVQEKSNALFDEIISRTQSEDNITLHGVTCTKLNTTEGIEEGIFSGNEDADAIDISNEKSLVVCLSDTFNSPSALTLNKRLQNQEHALLNVTVNEDEVIFGPLVRFQKTACLTCVSAQVQYFNFSFKNTAKVTINRDDISRKVAQKIASLWEQYCDLNSGGCYTIKDQDWVLLSNTLKNPNCPVCSRWSHTPKEVFYS